MKQYKLVAWGIIASLGLAFLTGFGMFGDGEVAYQVAGLGMFVFGIWATVIMFSLNKHNQ